MYFFPKKEKPYRTLQVLHGVYRCLYLDGSCACPMWLHGYRYLYYFWAPSASWPALPLHSDWTGPSLPSYCSIRRLPVMVSYWHHHCSSQICWLETTLAVCGSECVWVQLGPLLRVSQGQNQGVGQPGLLSGDSGKESIPKPI